ncbi:hypothetical protein SESBI_07052 [Sesbania bispinosa]|nr:hypothetical protein SESBI_07052 [Sesbania bispinosa]
MELGEIMLRVEDENVTFFVFKAMKHPMEKESLFRIEVIDSLIHEEFKRGLTKNPLEKALMEGKCAKDVKSEDENDNMLECIHQLESLKSLGVTTKSLRIEER